MTRRRFTGEPWPQDPAAPPAPMWESTEFPARRVLVMAVAWAPLAPRRGDARYCGRCGEDDQLGGYSVRVYAETGSFHPQCFLDHIGIGHLDGDADMLAAQDEADAWPEGRAGEGPGWLAADDGTAVVTELGGAS